MSSYARVGIPLKSTKEARIRTIIIMFAIGCILFVTLFNRLNFGNNDIKLSNFKSTKFMRNSEIIELETVSSKYSNSTPELEPIPSINLKNKTPIILYWNEYFSDEFKHFVPKESTKIQCPYKCIHTADRQYGAKADIRVFHERNFDSENLPPNNPDALNIYYTLEPPYLTYSKWNRQIKEPLNYFNFTGSYRTRSEIYYPYDTFIKIDGTENPEDVWTDKQVEEKLAGKRKGALIAMSNCGAESKRHGYVRSLRRHIEVTQVGACDGNVQCEKDPDGKALRIDMDCMHKLNDEHHFYLAFENSVCPEYTTEKFWRMKQLIVPVVLSRSVMAPHIPNDTYIAASDFNSPKDLANYLKQLMEDRDEYRRYFKWTKLYRKTRVTEEEIMISCQLCKLAHQQKKHVIENYKIYWSQKECVRDYAINLLTNSDNDINGVECYERRLQQIMKSTYRRRTIGKIL